MSAKKGYLAGLASAGTGANVKATEEEAPPTVAAKPGLPLSPVRPCPLTALRITAKNPFQPLAPDELTRLADDIRKNGVLVPLIVLPGKNHPGGRILAGHNRAKAAKLAGLDTVPVQYIEGKLSKDEERRLIITDNLLRRQLDTAQKAALLAALYPGYFDGPEQAGRKKELVHGAPINTQEAVAKAAGVSVDTVKRAKAVHKTAKTIAARTGKNKPTLDAYKTAAETIAATRRDKPRPQGQKKPAGKAATEPETPDLSTEIAKADKVNKGKGPVKFKAPDLSEQLDAILDRAADRVGRDEPHLIAADLVAELRGAGLAQ